MYAQNLMIVISAKINVDVAERITLSVNFKGTAKRSSACEVKAIDISGKMTVTINPNCHH